jgi:hypothetical protein
VPLATAVVFASSCPCPKIENFPSIHANQDASQSQQQVADTFYRRLPGLALAFNRASLLLPLDLFQTLAATSIVGGTAAHQWIGNFLVVGQITKSISELE